MEQTATGLLVIGWRLAFALVAGIPVLTTIGMFLLARFTHVFDAYAGERAKLLAQFHNLDKLVEQTKALTATTETIKARISDEIWDRQQRRLKRIECYVQVLERLAAYVDSTYELRVAEQQLSAHPDSHGEVYLHLLTQKTAALNRYNLAVAGFNDAKTTAELVCAKEPVDILRTFRAPSFASTNLEAVLEQAGNRAMAVSIALVAAARSDLGYESLN